MLRGRGERARGITYCYIALKLFISHLNIFTCGEARRSMDHKYKSEEGEEVEE